MGSSTVHAIQPAHTYWNIELKRSYCVPVDAIAFANTCWYKCLIASFVPLIDCMCFITVL